MQAYDLTGTAASILAQPAASESLRRHDIATDAALCFAMFAVCDALAYLCLRYALPKHVEPSTATKLRGCIVSCVHDVVSVPFVLILQQSILMAADGPSGVLGIGPLAHVPMWQIDVAGAVFGGFIVWDICHHLMSWEAYAPMADLMAHHGAFLAMIYLNKDTLWLNYAFPILYTGEWSTFFLNIRIMYRLLGKEEMVWSALFALAFFVFRILLLGLLVTHLISQAPFLSQLLSTPLLLSYLGLLPAMYLLNCFWFYKIVCGIARVLNGQSDGSSDGMSTSSTADDTDGASAHDGGRRKKRQ